MNGIDPRLRFRVFIDGELVDETWVNVCTFERLDTIEQVWARHHRLIAQAQTEGKRWLIEIHDPRIPEDQALRFGTEQAGIQQPAVDLADLVRQIVAHVPGSP